MAGAVRRKIAFPRYAEYHCAFRYIAEQALGVQYILPPPLTRHTMELGAKYSPEFVCTPFKTCLGSMMEALEAGADTMDSAAWVTTASFWSRFCGILAISSTLSTSLITI